MARRASPAAVMVHHHWDTLAVAKARTACPRCRGWTAATRPTTAPKRKGPMSDQAVPYKTCRNRLASLPHGMSSAHLKLSSPQFTGTKVNAAMKYSGSIDHDQADAGTASSWRRSKTAATAKGTAMPSTRSPHPEGAAGALEGLVAGVSDMGSM